MEDHEKGVMALAALRIVIGFMCMWAFFDKLLGLGRLTTKEDAMINGGSPTEYYLSSLVSGPFEGMWHALAGNAIIDWLLMFGLLALGISLMLGFASRLSTIGTVIMVVLMYMMVLPPSDNILVTHHIVYAAGIMAVYWLGAFDKWSVNGYWNRIPIVERLWILR